LLAKAECQSMLLVTDTTPSRASPLPHLIFGIHKKCVYRKFNLIALDSIPAIEIHFPAQCLTRLIRPQVLDKQIHHH